MTEHYFDMSGRVGRKEFWWWVAACFVVFLAAAIIDGIVSLGVLRPLIGLALLLPMAGMGARRLQDTGRNGALVWILVGLSALMQVIALLAAITGPLGAVGFLFFFFSIGWLISLATLIISVVLIYFWIQPGSPETNAYGPPPPDFSPMAPAPKTS